MMTAPSNTQDEEFELCPPPRPRSSGRAPAARRPTPRSTAPSRARSTRRGRTPASRRRSAGSSPPKPPKKVSLKLKDIEVGGRYHARVSGTLAVVRVVELKQI